MMCDMGVIFKMMLFNCLFALLGSILAEGKRHSLELLEMSFLKNQKSITYSGSGTCFSLEQIMSSFIEEKQPSRKNASY